MTPHPFAPQRLLPVLTVAVMLLQPQPGSKAQDANSSALRKFARRFELPLKLPGATRKPVMNAAARRQAEAMKAKLQRFPTYEGWRKLAALYENSLQYEEAAKALRAEGAMYRRKGLIDAALIEENKAANLETQLGLYYQRPATSRELDKLYTGARLEPIIGTYRGAFIDRDDQLRGKSHDENWQEHRSIPEFESLTGHKHASYFMYVAYGQKFPRKWIEECKRADAIPHIAWEPRDMRAVRDDAYLQSWAQGLRSVDWPVFIRFAGEMNGFWTPYHNDARLYRERFALVHQTLRRAAPKVATIWCVNSIPLNNIEKYYPGDDNCDWVGINIYSVPFADNNPARPTARNTPMTLVDPIYKTYAARKPIAICEYAASHMAAADRKPRNDFAIDKMAIFYTSLPLLYPRIKLIDWFSMNTMKHAKPGRQLSNYNLTEQPDILAAYRAIHANPHFLGTREHMSEARPDIAVPLRNGQEVRDTLKLSIWVKTYVPRPRVYLRWNGKLVYGSRRPGAHQVNLDLNGVAAGPQALKVFVFDDRNNFIESKSAYLDVR